jgi:lysophospholipase L1-like esterase
VIASHHLKIVIAALVLLGSACSPDGGSATGTGGASGAGSGGTSSAGGTTASGGTIGQGGTTGSGGNATGGSTAAGGASGTGGGTTTTGTYDRGGSTSAGGISGSGGASGAGGTTANGGTGAGGRTGAGGTRATGGTGAGGRTGAGGTRATGGTGAGGQTGTGGITGNGGTGGPDAGNRDLAGPETGTGGGTGTFDPCPAAGACKILPLGDSITWGVNYDGGYRVKLFSNTITDKKNITYVGKLSNGPATVSGTTFPKNNEGHSGWTIQQLDDIVTGKSTDASYTGKKMMVDLAPNIVLLHAGTNDTSRSPTGMSDRLGTLIDHIVTDGPDVLLVVTTIVPIKQGSYGTVAESFNKEVPGVVQKRIDAGKHVLLVDMFKNFPSNGLSSDGVHPNQTGYDWMAGVWYDAIKGYLH